MSVFNRPMFRVPGMNNQASGIMASSPNLIRASVANANPLLTGSATNTFQIPMYKDEAKRSCKKTKDKRCTQSG